MQQCIDATGVIDWNAYALLTTVVPLPDFMDLEELAIVAADRKFAWDVFLANKPEYLQRLHAGPRPREPEDDAPPRRRAPSRPTGRFRRKAG